MATYSAFPENYSVHRKHRNLEGGGVFITIMGTLVSGSMSDINVNCEVILTGLQLSDCEPIYIASY